MRKIFLFLTIGSALFSCNIRDTRPKVSAATADINSYKDSTTVELIDSVFNFGKITDGEKVEYNYKFRNTGKTPLVIFSARASCGCTVPETPEAPIAPGKIGFLKVVFDSRGRGGSVHKDITVVANAYPAFPVLQLIGEVMNQR